MAQDGRDILAPLIDQIMADVAGPLTDGLEADAAAWADRVYRGTILPRELRFAVDDTDEQRRSRVQIVTGDLRRAFESLDPAGRWDFIVHRYYLASLTPFTDEAFELAKRRFAGEDPGTLATEANSVRESVRGILAELDERAPQVRARMQAIISDALVDCAYAIGETEMMSLRMAPLAERARKAQPGRCASCGATNPADSHFCNNCGEPLAGDQI